MSPPTYRRDTMNDDIPFLIDPSYSRPVSRASQRSSSSCSSYVPHSSSPRANSVATAIYTDPQGRIHDPTRRMFAVVSATSTSSRVSASKRRQLSVAQQSRYEFHIAVGHIREAELDDEDEQDATIDDKGPYRRPQSVQSFGGGGGSPPKPQFASYNFPPTPLVRPPWAHATFDGLPNYCPPDPSSPFTRPRAILDEDQDATSQAEEDCASVMTSRPCRPRLLSLQGCGSERRSRSPPVPRIGVNSDGDQESIAP